MKTRHRTHTFQNQPTEVGIRVERGRPTHWSISSRNEPSHRQSERTGQHSRLNLASASIFVDKRFAHRCLPSVRKKKELGKSGTGTTPKGVETEGRSLRRRSAANRVVDTHPPRTVRKSHVAITIRPAC